ncbi:Zinc finger protein [Zostera marina]|uniref:Zinc finger protein n=1 Tax=Zostera marina TaxID=29655 RepID=A0A0K9PCR7_ZOSMR|nr:Zinc finger protein [Zostera marina]
MLPIEEDKEMHLRLFSCKSCNRLFPSFQALGGHRSGHHRGNLNNFKPVHMGCVRMMKRRKAHICAECGLEFPVGQALGGHMRMHRKKKMSKDVSCNNESKDPGRRSELHFDLNVSPPDLCADHFDFLNLSLGLGI